MTDAPKAGVDAVNRALAVLKCFSDASPVLSLAEISRETGLYKSTVLRLAASLEQAGFLHRRPDKMFAPGAELPRLGAVYRKSFDLESYVRPILRSLVEDTHESATFYRRDGDRRVCLFREDGKHAIRDHIREGEVLTMTAGAAAHVLAQLTEAGTDEHTSFMEALPLVSLGERDGETAAVAAPVYQHDGMAGCISLSGPITRFTKEHIGTIAPALLDAVRTVSATLGGSRYWLAAGVKL